MDSDFYPDALDATWYDMMDEYTDKCRYCGAAIINADAHFCQKPDTPDASKPDLADLRRSVRKMLGR